MKSFFSSRIFYLELVLNNKKYFLSEDSTNYPWWAKECFDKDSLYKWQENKPKDILFLTNKNDALGLRAKHTGRYYDGEININETCSSSQAYEEQGIARYIYAVKMNWSSGPYFLCDKKDLRCPWYLGGAFNALNLRLEVFDFFSNAFFAIGEAKNKYKNSWYEIIKGTNYEDLLRQIQ